MTDLTLRYDTETNRVTQTYWGDGGPAWADVNRDGTAVVTIKTTQQARADALAAARDGVEAGTDYDPDVESATAQLCYNPDTEALTAEIEITTRPDAV